MITVASILQCKFALSLMAYGFDWPYGSWLGCVIALVVAKAITTLKFTMDFINAKCRMEMNLE
jgi:hypothetical protein